MACGRDDPMAPPTTMETLYWTLRTNYPAVQLSMTSPYNTVQLTTAPYTTEDNIWIPGSDIVDLRDTTVWRSADPSKVEVSASGFVTARAPTTGVLLTVSRQIGEVTHKDTVRVQVNTLLNPPVLESFRIRPTDSLKRAINAFGIVFPLTVLGQRDSIITGLPVAYRSSNANIGRYSNKWNNNLQTQSVAGITRISAATYAYGVAMTDTFTLEVGWSLSLFIGNPAVVQQALPDGKTVFKLKASRQDIGPGGVVYWENASGQRPVEFTGTLLPFNSMNVVFDDPTNVLEAAAPNASGSGNIMAIPGDSTLSVIARRGYRRFAEAGEYRYTIQPFGFRGVVVVHDR